MNNKAVEYGVFYSSSGVNNIIAGMKRFLDKSRGEEQLKLNEMVHSIELASEKFGDMVVITEPEPFNQDFVVVAEKLMQENLIDAAEEILTEFTSEIPATWKPRQEFPEEDFIFF